MEDLFSIIFELRVKNGARIPATTGHLAHASFLNLIKGFDPALSARLHDQHDYKPFTISPLRGVQEQEEGFMLQRGQHCSFRITLLDGGYLWHRLSTYFLEAGPIQLFLGPAQLQLIRMISSSTADPTGWAGTTNWQALLSLPVRQLVTLHFVSPTAFSAGNRQFELFPKPFQVWKNLQLTWNSFAPEAMMMKKDGLQEFLTEKVTVVQCNLSTTTLHFPEYAQKGFLGTCRYSIQEDNLFASRLTTLAAFARYAGIGYKTRMGMGQVRADFAIPSMPS
jgi:CRISPR-associated endoribonuclease Cas6